MARAARISFAELTSLMRRMPNYGTYCSLKEAHAGEKGFRRALGRMLKECGDRLLNVAERRPSLLSQEQQRTIDTLVERISVILRRLDREGQISLVGDSTATIAELEEIDIRLILLVEEALILVRKLNSRVPSARWFHTDAGLLSRDLAAFNEATEERNYLLGLGWESEFDWNGRGSNCQG